MAHSAKSKTLSHQILGFIWTTCGAFLAALSLKMFIQPNDLIDGGITGIAMIFSRLYGTSCLVPALILLNIPFIYLAFRYIRRVFVIHMSVALILFAGCLYLLQGVTPFIGDTLEVIFFGGALLGIGSGLIIRYGGCLDGSEILAILIHRKKGFTVGQIILVLDFFIFGAYGWIFQDWHIALKSFMMFIVAFKMIDMVMAGLNELKSVLIISSKPKHLSEVIISQMGLGLTVLHGKGGFSGNSKDILFVIVERLDLSDLKELVLQEDPQAFMTIENLHEVVHGHQAYVPYKKKGRTNQATS
ncbi:MAG: YitT family protein [Rhabdochlamydiaceae bacterium]|nr:YitT family protein [Rhabdochlamydiaceae bacterium]